MKYLLAAVALASTALVGCNSMSGLDGYDAERQVMIDGQPKVVAVQDMASFDIEIAPYKVVCELPTVDANVVKGECLQYRQPFQDTFNVMTGDIQNFNFEPGYHYVLDVSQRAVPNDATGKVHSIWVMNSIKSKTPVSSASVR